MQPLPPPVKPSATLNEEGIPAVPEVVTALTPILVKSKGGPIRKGRHTEKLGHLCCLCRHPQREAIDLKLSQGVAITHLARELNISRPTLIKHRDAMQGKIAKLVEQRHERGAATVLDEMRAVQSRAWQLLNTMSGEGDHRGATLALRECREVLEAMDRNLTKAAEAAANKGMSLILLDASREEYCSECRHCAKKTNQL